MVLACDKQDGSQPVSVPKPAETPQSAAPKLSGESSDSEANRSFNAFKDTFIAKVRRADASFETTPEDELPLEGYDVAKLLVDGELGEVQHDVRKTESLTTPHVASITLTYDVNAGEIVALYKHNLSFSPQDGKWVLKDLEAKWIRARKGEDGKMKTTEGTTSLEEKLKVFRWYRLLTSKAQ